MLKESRCAGERVGGMESRRKGGQEGPGRVGRRESGRWEGQEGELGRAGVSEGWSSLVSLAVSSSCRTLSASLESDLTASTFTHLLQ